MRVRILNETDVRALIDNDRAIAECRRAFASLGRGEVELPDVLTIRIEEQHGEVHGKGGYIHGSPYFSIKVATGFYRNPERGLPVTSGGVWVFSAVTGHLELMLLDNGYLTELRTGAAGAVAADLLARPVVDTVAVIGAGVQARYQLEALVRVRAPKRVLVWSRDQERARGYAAEMTGKLGIPVAAVGSAREAVEAAGIVVTATPSEAPVVRSEWVRPGTHLTAMGSDMPHKRELDGPLLARATVVADRLAQCLTQGEIHHAVADGSIAVAAVHAELGEIAAGLRPGRTRDDEITVADLTGVGVLDAAVAGAVAVQAVKRDVGRWLEA